MPTLQELHEQCRKAPAAERNGDDTHRERIAAVLREAGVGERAEAEFGDFLWALSVIPAERSDEKQEKQGSPEWTLVFLTTNIEITDQEITAFAEGDSVFDPSGPDECLIGDVQLEDLRLLHQAEVTESDLLNVFAKLTRALEINTRHERVRHYLRNALFQFGTNAQAFAQAKHKELRARQRIVDPRQLREETRNALLARQIASRKLALRRVFGDMPVRQADEIGRLGGLVNRMEHLDAVRHRVFYSENGRSYIEELLKGRLLDHGLLVRLAVANDHLDQLLKRFENYVVGYAVTGSWLARSDDARLDSDLDVIVLINDIDVQKMGRRELTACLSGIVQGMAVEAANAKGMEASILHPTLMLLTKALQSQHDGEVVLWSMLERAFVLHDPHSYLRAWQLLLRQGAVAPSERLAVELLDNARTDVFYTYHRIRECVMNDLYAGVLKASQSLLMRLGERVLPPARVIEELRDRAKRGQADLDVTALSDVAECLERLRHHYQEYKRTPFLQLSPERLVELMRDGERSFDVLENLCESLGIRSFRETLRELPIVGAIN